MNGRESRDSAIEEEARPNSCDRGHRTRLKGFSLTSCLTVPRSLLRWHSRRPDRRRRSRRNRGRSRRRSPLRLSSRRRLAGVGSPIASLGVPRRSSSSTTGGSPERTRRHAAGDEDFFAMAASKRCARSTMARSPSRADGEGGDAMRPALLPQPGGFEGFLGVEEGPTTNPLPFLESTTEPKGDSISAPLAVPRRACDQSATVRSPRSRISEYSPCISERASCMSRIDSRMPSCPRYTVRSPPSAVQIVECHSTSGSAFRQQRFDVQAVERLSRPLERSRRSPPTSPTPRSPAASRASCHSRKP